MTELIYITFPVSGVTTWIFIPPLVAFAVSFFTAMGGISGAFMLLPFQMSLLNYTAPSVSGTNQFFNLIAIPGGVWQYIHEKRMVWPLVWVVSLGTLPGVVMGIWIRIEFLPEPGNFKFFAGLVLFYLAGKLLLDIIRRKATSQPDKLAKLQTDFFISEARFSFKRVDFRFCGQSFFFSVPGVFSLCFIVGIIGGAYGIGGGAIIAPVLVSFFELPVYAVAGASLLSTFITSIVGVATYQILALIYPDLAVAPDFYLGFLFGIGGSAGMYFGARCQKYVPAHRIKFMVCFCTFGVALKYIVDFF